MSLDVEKINFLVKATQTPATSSFSTLSDVVSIAIIDTLTDGTGADFADQIYHSSDRSLSALTADTFDLAGGISDKFGNTLTMATVKLLIINNKSTNGAHLEMGSATNAWEGWSISSSTSISIAPGGSVILYDPTANAMEVTAGTGDELQVLNLDATNTATYDILIIGASSLTT